MKLEIGKYYRTRDGRKVGPIMWRDRFDEFDEPFVFQLQDGTHYSRTGVNGAALSYIEEDESDIISEWADEPATGTLAELNVKPGDVVACYNSHHSGTQYTVGDFVQDWYGYDMPWWRIISRATPSPVRTVTRKEIVPGVYGRVSIHDLRGEDGELHLAFVDTRSDKERTIHARMTHADLTAAIETLQQIKEAME